MARPQVNKVDYFPHPVTHGKKMSYMEKKYGNNGYATWFKILEEIGNTDYHYLNLSDEVQIMFLSDRCLVSEEELILIINDLVRLNEFDKDLWENNRILFNEKFVDTISDAYNKRTNNCINKEGLLRLLDGLGVLKLPKSNLQGVENTQSKVKYIKEDKSKVDIDEKSLKFTKKDFKNELLKLGAEEKHIDDWIVVRTQKKAVFTETALNRFINECTKHNLMVADIVQICAEKSWSGFEYNWLQNINGQASKQTFAVNR